MSKNIDPLLLHQCHHQLSTGKKCGRVCDNKGFCNWHNPEGQSKKVDISKLLADNLKSGNSGEGYILKHCDLNNIDLVNRGCHEGFNLIGADFYRANLRSAHLFKANLKDGSLMKADLSHANLHEANLEGCNLLGAKFDGAKIENVKWGAQLLQEAQAKEDPERALEYYQQVVEICRGIRKAAENQGLFETAGYFFHKEMMYRRFQIPKYSFARVISKIVDIVCGYGEKPLRVVTFSILFIMICAIGFAFGGVAYNGENIQISMDLSLWQNIKVFLGSIYFSVVTFTTLGYGDLTPLGMVRTLAAFEAFIGSFTSALFVVVFVKKMTR